MSYLLAENHIFQLEMEPNQQPTSNERILKIEPIKKLEETSLEPKIPESADSVPLQEKNNVEVKAPEFQQPNDEKTENKLEQPGIENCEREAGALNCNKNVLAGNESEAASNEKECEKTNLPSFPGTVTKSVPGSNDVKIEIDSNSLLDRVILYSLKNTVVDNSRLDAAKNKYMLHSGNITSSLNCNSNESDSNSSSKSVEKLIDEFKVGCSKANIKSLLIDSSTKKQGDNVNNESFKGAESFVNKIEGNRVESNNNDFCVEETDQNVIPPMMDEHLQTKSEAVQKNCQVDAQELSKFVPPILKQETSALDYRVNESLNTSEGSDETLTQTLDFSASNSSERSIPTVKRNHALYVGLPDFSKEIFTASSINRESTPLNLQQNVANNVRQAEIKSPQVLNLQMNHPDFSKGFTRAENQLSPLDDLPITPSNFSEIARKKNYISDLQLKPTSQSLGKEETLKSHSSSYKIDYGSTAAISQELMPEPKYEPPLVNYPNMKKEEINAYNQQLIVDEPMAHIIHKNQFLPRAESWNKRTEPPPLNGSNLISKGNETTNNRSRIGETINRSQIPQLTHQHQSFSENAGNPSHYQRPFKPDTNSEFFENQLRNEFSLKHKELQLRQEGTIITIKNEPLKNSAYEIGEGSTEGRFHDYELNQPKKSSDVVDNRQIHQHSFRSQQFNSSVPPPLDNSKYEKKFEIPSRTSSAAMPQMYPQEMQAKQYAANSKAFDPRPPLSYHYKTEKLISFQPGSSSLNNTPQSWPTVQRYQSSLMTEPENKSFPSAIPFKHQSQLPRSSIAIDEFAYPSQSGMSTGNMKLGYQPMKHTESYSSDRAPNSKNIPHQNYNYPRDLNSEQKYYHQKYPDFSRHFEPVKKLTSHAQNANYSSTCLSSDQRHTGGDTSFQRFPQHQEQDIRFSRDSLTPQYPMSAGPSHSLRNNASTANTLKDNRNMLPINQETAIRTNEEMLERNRYTQSLKVERDVEEGSIKTHDRNQTYSLKPLHPNFTMPALKTEPIPVERIPASTSNIEHATKPANSEIRKDSPLDLSVKTVKTKADSTGCEQESSSRLLDPTGLKVEFTPNFNNKMAKTPFRQQVFHGPMAYPERTPIEKNSYPVNERPAFFKTDNDFKIKNASQIINIPTVPNQQQHHAPRSFLLDQFNPTLRKNEQEQHKTPSPAYTSNRPERSHISPISKNYNIEEAGRIDIANLNQVHTSQEIRQIADKSYAVPNRMASYNCSSVPKVAVGIDPRVGVMKPYHRISTIEKSKTSNPSQGIVPPSRDPFYYERERDRKHVEDILYRRKRNDVVSTNSSVQHFKPIVSPPRKRASEIQHIYNTTSPKQGKVQEQAREVQMLRHHHLTDSHDNLKRHPEQSRFQKFEDHFSVGEISEKNFSHIEQRENHFSNNKDNSMLPSVPQKETAFNESVNSSSSQYYPNPKAEMIQRADSMSGYSQERNHLNQNFQLRPDDNAFQLSSRIHHPIFQDSGITNISHPIGPGMISSEPPRPTSVNITSNFPLNSGNINRGADQKTILKLKTNLELKEQKKQSKTELCEDVEEKQRKDFSPRQFRTKGELKGFIPLPANVDAPIVNSNSSPSLPLAPSAFDLLDWGTACNDFVQQLQTVETQVKKKRTIILKRAEKKLLTIPVITPPSSLEISIVTPIQQNDEKHSSSDEDKPLLELVSHKSVGSDNNKTHSSVMRKISEKISRNNREKQRLELEQKHAARLGPSSSESDSETRRPLRTALRVRRLRKRAAVGIKNTDEELSVEEETEEEEISEKKGLSKLVDDLTSSEDEKKLNQAKPNNSKDKNLSSSTSKTSKKGVKPKENDSEPSESDDTLNNKLTKSSFKSAKKSKVSESNDKITLEEKTMTRSKRKLEIEKKLSNSKILRNEKIVQNVTPDKKPKIETTSNSNKKILSKQKDSAKTDGKKSKLNESDSDANLNRRRNLETVAKEESSSSTEESHTEQINKTERYEK